MATKNTNKLFLKGATDFFGKAEFATVEYVESLWEDGFATYIEIKSFARDDDKPAYKRWMWCANHTNDEEPRIVFLNAIDAADESDEYKEKLRELTNFAMNMMSAYNEEGEETAKMLACANLPKFDAYLSKETKTEFGWR